MVKGRHNENNIPHKPIIIKMFMSGLIITVAIIPINAISPKIAKQKGIVKNWAPIEADNSLQIFRGIKGVRKLFTYGPIEAIPSRAEYESRKDTQVPS